jgi:hypothetical protein
MNSSNQPTRTIRTLEQKIDELANTIVGLHNMYKVRKKVIMKQIREVRQLASDLNVDEIQLRKMISHNEVFSLYAIDLL